MAYVTKPWISAPRSARRASVIPRAAAGTATRGRFAALARLLRAFRRAHPARARWVAAQRGAWTVFVRIPQLAAIRARRAVPIPIVADRRVWTRTVPASLIMTHVAVIPIVAVGRVTGRHFAAGVNGTMFRPANQRVSFVVRRPSAVR